ncbi:acylpyruvate hydrolase [Aureococcus anophagefferens]|nr:acylpyruvate hydrolase [Aureococcus anophagefferens]
MMMGSLTLLLAASAAARTTDRIIRFKDADGAIHTGAYEGRGVASLVDGWEVLDQKVEVAELLAPVERPPYVLGIGLNYWGHINSTNMSAPKTPQVFFKGSNSYAHPGDVVEIPAFSTRPDYEGELGFVFKADCKDVAEADAVERSTTARAARATAASGPSPSPSTRTRPSGRRSSPRRPSATAAGSRLTTRVNGELRQNTSTSDLIFGVPKIVAFITQGTTIPEGTVVCTGTPDGVGVTMHPPAFLQDGDVVEVALSKIGTLRNPVARGGAKRERGPTTPDELDAILLG